MTFADKMRDWVDKGLKTSKDALAQAGEKVQQLGEKGVLRMEILQLRSQAQKLTTRLGAEVYETLVEKGQKTVAKDSPAVRETIEKITALEATIDEKEAAFAKIGGNEEELNEPKA